MSVFDIAADGSILTFRDSVINYVWYIEVKVVWPHGPIKVEVLRHYRIHHSADNHPKTVGTFRTVENSARTLCALDIAFDNEPGRMVAAVENPQHVFSYNE